MPRGDVSTGSSAGLAHGSQFDAHRHLALGIGAASFWSAAEKDIAESPTAERSGAGTPRKRSSWLEGIEELEVQRELRELRE